MWVQDVGRIKFPFIKLQGRTVEMTSCEYCGELHERKSIYCEKHKHMDLIVVSRITKRGSVFMRCLACGKINQMISRAPKKLQMQLVSFNRIQKGEVEQFMNHDCPKKKERLAKLKLEWKVRFMNDR
jgi:uncharacterized Zn finger protein